MKIVLEQVTMMILVVTFMAVLVAGMSLMSMILID